MTKRKSDETAVLREQLTEFAEVTVSSFVAMKEEFDALEARVAKLEAAAKKGEP